MAFLAHPPRRSARSQLSTSASTASLSHPGQSTRRGETSTHLSERNGQDWSVVFPGRSVVETVTTPMISPESTSPFVSSPDERDPQESNVELTLPHDQDGTGRFTRPSTPSYAADDEQDEDEVDQALNEERNKTLMVPSIKIPSIRDTGSSNSDLDNDSDLDALEITSSILISGSERGRRDSSVSQRRRRISEWDNGAGSSSLSSSWAWMNVEGSTYPRRGKEKAGRNTEVLPVVFTSGSEAEDETLDRRMSNSQQKKEEDEAFEEALGNAPTAQSAGLMARAPKRRHRKNGESAKGSKRSNSSAVPASDMRLSRRSAALRSRRPATSNLSVSVRSGSRSRYVEPGEKIASTAQDLPGSQGILKAILRKIFQVDDDEVLQAFLRDDGPLRVDESLPSKAAVDTASALAMISAQHTDDVWARNERKRHLRTSHAVAEETEEDAQEEDRGQFMRITRSGSSSEIFAAPHRIRLQSNVGEPTLLEALQASVLSSLATVPSGFSILLAGSRSARLVNYLAGRFVGQIGPSLTERVRKLIDDAEDDTSIQDDIFGSETRSSSTSSIRFRGSSHPAISSRSSSTIASKEQLS